MSAPESSAVEPGAAERAAVIIASTRAAQGSYEDLTGPVIVQWLRSHGFAVQMPVVVPDGEAVGTALRAALAQQHTVVITSGGTGLSADDQTPDMTRPLLDREIPGIMEAIRAAGLAKTPMAALSRGHAGLAGSTLIVNLPGSPSGVRDGLDVLDPIIKHLCDQVAGRHGH